MADACLSGTRTHKGGRFYGVGRYFHLPGMQKKVLVHMQYFRSCINIANPVLKLTFFN